VDAAQSSVVRCEADDSRKPVGVATCLAQPTRVNMRISKVKGIKNIALACIAGIQPPPPVSVKTPGGDFVNRRVSKYFQVYDDVDDRMHKQSRSSKRSRVNNWTTNEVRERGAAEMGIMSTRLLPLTNLEWKRRASMSLLEENRL
jgi:hypothetical protein